MRGCEGQRERRGPTCREILRQACEHLNDRLPIPTQIRVTLHLAACGHCRTYVKQVGVVQQTLIYLPKQNPVPINHDLLRRRFSLLHTQ